MDRFNYFAIDLDGNDIRGELDAWSARDAFSKLAEVIINDFEVKKFCQPFGPIPKGVR